MTAFLFLCFSSGLGFLVAKWFPNSIDLWVSEANTFLSLNQAPHFIVSQGLIVIVFWLFFLSVTRKQYRFAVLAGLASLILSFEHPFDLPVVMLTIGLYTTTIILCQQKIDLKLASLAFLSFGPGFLGLSFYYWAVKSSLVIQTWNLQNQMLSPSLYDWLVGYGLLIPLSLFGVSRSFANKEKGLLLLSWVLATVVLLFSPFSIQRRFANGLHIPLVILAAYGLEIILERFRNRRVLLVIIITMILFASNAYNIYQDISGFQSDKTDDYYYYLPKKEIEAINWFKTTPDSDKVIVSTWFYGNLIPGLTGRRVYQGHAVQTVNAQEKTKLLDEFLVMDE
jgi:hypothetical protein